MKIFSFIILHYLTSDDTIQCIESIIRSINYNNYFIVVVDNASYNDSFKILEEKFKDESKVHLIKNEYNMGFAKGNNVGYSYAKNVLKSDYIMCINNDTLIEQNNFIDIAINLFEYKKYDILGPDIISTKDGFHQNPMNLKAKIENNVIKKTIMKNIILLIMNYLHFEDIYKNLKNKIKKSSLMKYKNELYDKEMENVKIHGACILFSPNYVKRYNGFFDKTFMYMEEDILFYIAKRDNLKIMYTPDLHIYHKEFSATNYYTKKSNKTLRFRYKNTIKSGYEFLKLKNRDYKSNKS